MFQKIASLEEFFITAMLESWAHPECKAIIKPVIVNQQYYEHRDTENKNLKFDMRISKPARNTHKCDGSISLTESCRKLWTMRFEGMCMPEAIPLLQFFHRKALSEKRFVYGSGCTCFSEGDYRYRCTPISDSDFTSFEGSESIRFGDKVIARFSYAGRATGFVLFSGFQR